MRAVRAGGDRQDAHERIRGYSIAAARAHQGRRAEQRSPRSHRGGRRVRHHARRAAIARMDPRRFVGRAPEQVDEFLAEVVEPLLAGATGERRRRWTRCAYERRSPPTTDPAAAAASRQGARRVRRRRRAAAARRERSGQRVRRRDGASACRTRVPCSRSSPRGGCGSSGRSCRTTCSAPTPTRSCRGSGARARIATRSPAVRCCACAPTVFPVECVVRGYLSGSAWKEYRASGTLAGEPLPAGLRRERPIRSAALLPGDQGGDGARREHPGRRGARRARREASATRSRR